MQAFPEWPGPLGLPGRQAPDPDLAPTPRPRHTHTHTHTTPQPRHCQHAPEESGRERGRQKENGAGTHAPETVGRGPSIQGCGRSHVQAATRSRWGGGTAGTTNPRGCLEEEAEGMVLGGAGRSEAERGWRGGRITLQLPVLRARYHVGRQQLQPDPKPGHPRHSPGGPKRRRAAAARGLQYHPRRHALQHHPRR